MEAGAFELVTLLQRLGSVLAIVVVTVAAIEKIGGFPSSKIKDAIYGLASLYLAPFLIRLLNDIFVRMWGL